MKVLVTGCNGQLGNELRRLFETGTAEIGNDKSRVISWFAGYRSKMLDGSAVDASKARLVLVMLEVANMSEFNALKFDIARELLEITEQTNG